MKGYGGIFHGNHATLNTERFYNNSVVGIVLDMDRYEADFFVDGKHLVNIKVPQWEV